MHFWQFQTFPQFKNWFLAIFEIAQNGIWSKKFFPWNWFIWFHEVFCLDFFKFSGPLWYVVHIRNFKPISQLVATMQIYCPYCYYCIKLLYRHESVSIEWFWSLSFFNFSLRATSCLVRLGLSEALEVVKTRSKAPWSIMSCLRDLASRSTLLLMSLKTLSISGEVPTLLAYKSEKDILYLCIYIRYQSPKF